MVQSRSVAGNTHGPLNRVLSRSVRPDSLVFSIAHWLGSAIIEGSLPPGGSISSVDVAARFETSRAPVRDALIVLEREGLVTTSVGRASRVTHVGLDEIREIYEIRGSLHALVAQRVVRDAPDAAIADLRGIQTRLIGLAEAGSIDGYFWTNLEFRDTEALIAGNARLREVLDSLGLRTLLMRHVGLSQPGRLARSIIDHERLLDAYEQRNEELAVAVTRTIVRTGFELIERSNWSGVPARSRGGPSAVPQPVDRF